MQKNKKPNTLDQIEASDMMISCLKDTQRRINALPAAQHDDYIECMAYIAIGLLKGIRDEEFMKGYFDGALASKQFMSFQLASDLKQH
jgi:hypothetical protein